MGRKFLLVTQQCFPCLQLCGKNFISESLLRSHRNVCPAIVKGSHPCAICDRRFETLLDVERHFKNDHSSQKSTGQWLDCNKCSFSSDSIVIFKDHLKKHLSHWFNFYHVKIKTSSSMRNTVIINKIMKSIQQIWNQSSINDGTFCWNKAFFVNSSSHLCKNIPTKLSLIKLSQVC